MIEKLTQPILNSLRYGKFLLSLETVEPGQQMASIQYYGTPENEEPPRGGSSIKSDTPDYTTEPERRLA